MQLDLVVLVLRDNALGMIKWKQEDMGFQEYGLDFSNPDFVQYASAYGVSGHRVEAASEFLPLLQQALCAGGIHLLEVPVDYSHNDRVLNDEIRKQSDNVSP